MTPKQKNFENQANTLIERFKLRGIEGYYCATKEEALAAAKRFLTPGCSVSFGGSETLREIGLIAALNPAEYTVYDRLLAKTAKEKEELYSKIVTADLFFMSSNAITAKGELVNIDGIGNRVACLITGPKNVIIVAGMNKIVPDVEAGITRTRNIAAPPNSVRLDANTPCQKQGFCGDCLADDCLCCEIVITRKSRIPGRIKVILVGEELGF